MHSTKTITTQITIHAAPDKVWEVLTDFQNYWIVIWDHALSG